MAAQINIKGIRDGLLVSLGEGTWDEARSALLEQIDHQIDFFKGARLALEVGNHILKAVDLSQLRDSISERGITLWAVMSNSPTTEQTAQTLGLATRISKPLPERETRKLDTTIQGGEQALLVHRTLRSGFSLHHHGHVVVIGDVNPGAEIIASGDIIIWGRLRGMVHAGAEGNTNAFICALELNPIQIRIGGVVNQPPQRRGKLQPETARIINGTVVTEVWNVKV
jgi:septum site-determining protein MinC